MSWLLEDACHDRKWGRRTHEEEAAAVEAVGENAYHTSGGREN